MTDELNELVDRILNEDPEKLLDDKTGHQVMLDRALAEAAFHVNFDSVRLLLKQAANPNPTPHLGRSAIFCAIEQQNLPIIEFLLKNGADANAVAGNGWTALHAAVDIEGDGALQSHREPTSEVTELLLLFGADPTRTDGSARTGLDIARHYEHRAAIRVLERALEQNHQEVIEHARQHMIRVSSILNVLRPGDNPNATGEERHVWSVCLKQDFQQTTADTPGSILFYVNPETGVVTLGEAL